MEKATEVLTSPKQVFFKVLPAKVQHLAYCYPKANKVSECGLLYVLDFILMCNAS